MNIYNDDVTVRKCGIMRSFAHDTGISQHLVRGVVWEEDIIDMYEKIIKPGQTVIDIGAYIGCHTLPMANLVGKSGIVHCFEPQPISFDVLKYNVDVNNLEQVICYNNAVSSKNCQVYLNNLDVLKLDNPGGLGISFEKYDQKPFQIDAVSIDSLHIENASLMKIDVEGHEYDVLLGAKNTILNTKPIIFIEILGGVDYDLASEEDKKAVDDVKSLLQSYGTTVYRISIHDYVAIFSDKHDLEFVKDGRFYSLKS